MLLVSVEGVGTGWGKDFGVWYIAINQQTHLCSFTWISITGIISYKQLCWPVEQTPSTGTEVFTLDCSSAIIPTHNLTFNYSSEILFGAFFDFTDALRFLHLLGIYPACSRSVSVNNLFTRRSMKPFIRFYLTHSSSEVFINVWSICWKSWTLIKAWDNVRRSLCTQCRSFALSWMTSLLFLWGGWGWRALWTCCRWCVCVQPRRNWARTHLSGMAEVKSLQLHFCVCLIVFSMHRWCEEKFWLILIISLLKSWYNANVCRISPKYFRG